MSKNKWARIIAAVCVCFMLISFTACGNSSKKDETTKASVETSASQESTSSSKETTAAQQNAAIDSNILGQWEYESGGYTYDFKEDGTGTYDTGGTVMKFTYTADGSKVSITYEGNTEPLVLEYELNGDKLNVKDSFGKDTIYNKK